GGTIMCPGMRAEYAGNFQPTGGTVVFTDNPAGAYFNFWITNGNWLPNFVLNCDTGVNLGGDLTVKGDLILTSGSLDVTEDNYSINAGGYWINNTGGNAFNPRAGTVTFNKVGTLQNITGTNNFHNVIDLHSGNALDFQGPTSIGGTLTVNWIVSFQNAATISAISNTGAAGILAFYNGYTSTIDNYTGGGGLRSFTGSHVIINDLTQNGMYGSYTASNGHLEIHQDDYSWIDLNGPVEILNNGIIDLHGGQMDCYFAYSGNVSFTMSSGQFNVKDYGIWITDGTYDCMFNVSGGTISSGGSWYDDRGGFNPTGGTVEFTGDNSAGITAHASSWFHNLSVNKADSRYNAAPAFEVHRDGTVTPLTRNGTLIQNANCLVNGTLAVEAGTLATNGYTLTSAGNLIVNDVLKLSSGSVLQMGTNRSLTVNSGGLLETLGSSSQAVVITRSVSGNYALNIESGGTLAAAYTIFEYMNSTGVNIKDGALVDASNSLNNCTFRLGAGGGTLLTVNNAQDITVAGAAFPTNIWGGAYNVAKTLNQGSIYFTGFSGAFSGPAFEQDSFFRVHWEGTGLPAITDLSISYMESYDRIRLNWSYTVPGVQFRIYKSLVPEGPWSEAGTTANFTWNELVPGNYHFYRVTAYTP
ncbi:MAG: hypothetical protein PHG32_08420, partial [Candidatus Cloacimonetes bacterium]|nr:hypothetical protein [Candidatus Cloacimonadota bacterium]